MLNLSLIRYFEFIWKEKVFDVMGTFVLKRIQFGFNLFQ